MITENWKIQFVKNPDKPGYEMCIYRRVGDKTEVVVFPPILETKTIKAGDIIPAGIFFTEEMFQVLVDSIHKDYKPSEGKYTEGKLEATERHPQDLRQILKVKKLN